MTGGIVARWGSPHPRNCGECGTQILDTSCVECGEQVDARPIGRIGAVIETEAGDDVLVVARRTNGGWEPERAIAASDEALRMLARANQRPHSPTPLDSLYDSEEVAR
jgi:hypothetical protein